MPLDNKPLIDEGIYLLQEERFIETNKNIYKIGRSGNIYKRVSQYENGTIVYLMIACNNSENIESNLINIFHKDFKGVKYYGNEYFMGDLNAMKDTIIEYIKTTTDNDIKLINMEIKIETVDKESDTPIPKYQQELYSQAELTIIKRNTNHSNNDIESETEAEDAEEEEFIDCHEEIKPTINNYNRNNGNVIINYTINDRICPCGKSFAIPALLRRHQNGKLGCIPYMQYLIAQERQTVNITQNTQDNNKYQEKPKKDKDFICKYCNRNLATKFSMERHETTCKDNEDNKINKPENDTTDIINNTINNTNFKGFIESLANSIGNNLSKFEMDITTGKFAFTYLNDIKHSTI
jgi:hypothetical protein